MDHDYDGVPADTRAEEINRTDRWVRESYFLGHRTPMGWPIPGEDRHPED